jgi:N-acetylglutamate synthase-like GNAT family acetyltransferase
MTEQIKIVDVNMENISESPCCGIKNTEHKGYIQKTNWIKKYFKKGLKAKVLYTEDNRQFGYIEYLPGQYAWRAVEAKDYMLIHCIWTFYKKYQKKGYGKLLIQSAIDDAKKEKMKGVAVVTRKRPWLAKSEIFLTNGFETVDTAPPDYELLVKKFNTSSPNPKFKDNWEEKLKKYREGLTIIRADQCPHSIKFADEIAEMAKNTYKLKTNIVELRIHQDAQNAPTPCTMFAIIYNGRILADHQISRKRFENIMEKILK